MSRGDKAGKSGSTLPGANPLGPPLKIGRYQIVGRLATGGMAEVYLARHGEISGFQTLVVVKRILPHLASDPQFIEMFLDEARIAARLDHPNVVRIVEVGRSGSEYFLAMDLVQGESLAEIFRRGVALGKPMAPPQSAFAIAQAAHGLHHAHTLHDVAGKPLAIVHRDVSPQNVLASFEGAVRVIDFGVARALGRVSHTNTGGVKGKFGYMSPEQASGAVVDSRADIFALGVILWEALTSRRLFKRESDLATLRAIVDEPYPRPSDFAHVPPVLDGIVMRALDKDRDRRFPAAAELASSLEGWLYAEGGRAGGADLGRYLKDLLKDRHDKWKEAVRVALEKGNPPVELAQRALLGTPSVSEAAAVAALSAGRGRSRRGRTGDDSAPPGGDASGVNTVYEGGHGTGESAADAAGSGRRVARIALVGIALAVAAAVGFALFRPEKPVPRPVPIARPAPSIAPIAPLGPTPAAPIPTGRAQLFVVVTPKDARVLVDGIVKADATPIVIDLPPGRASVRIEREGYLPLAESVDLRGGRQLLFDRTLRPKPSTSASAFSRPSGSKTKSSGLDRHKKGKGASDTKPNPFD